MVPPDRRGSPTDAGTRFPSPARQIAKVVVEKEHLPFFDVAYQGFASGDLVEDAFAPRLFASKGIEFLCSQSYAKNLGLYGERIGALNAVLNSPEAATKVLSQLKRVARAMYSNPPVHGARIVAEVVNDPAMFKEWNEEMAMMSGRITGVRKMLHDNLAELMPEKDFAFILKPIGTFSFPGFLSPQHNPAGGPP